MVIVGVNHDNALQSPFGYRPPQEAMQVAPGIGVFAHHLTGVVDAEGMGDTCRSGCGQRRDDAAAKHIAVLGRSVAGAIGPHDDALVIDAESVKGCYRRLVRLAAARRSPHRLYQSVWAAHPASG